MFSGIAKLIELAFDHPILAPPLILIIVALVVSPYARYLWNRGRRGLRRLWLPVLIAFVCITPLLAGYGWCCYRFWGLPPPFAVNEIGFLIAEVPGDTERQRQNAYAQAIRELSEKTPSLKGVVKVRLIERPLAADPEKQHAEALRIGHWLHAAFVLRPYTIEGYQEPWLTVVDQPEFSKVEAPMGKFPSAQLANLDQLPLPSNLLLLARCALALAFYRQGAYDHVAGEFQNVLVAPGLPELAPSRSHLTLTYANALYFLRKNDEAITQFRKAIALKPDYADAHNNLGVALAYKDDLDGAMAEYREALRLKPDSAEAHNNLAVVLRDKHDLDGAMAEYREALRRSRTSPKRTTTWASPSVTSTTWTGRLPNIGRPCG